MPSIQKKTITKTKTNTETNKLKKTKDFQTLKAKLKQENPLWKVTDTKLN